MAVETKFDSAKNAWVTTGLDGLDVGGGVKSVTATNGETLISVNNTDAANPIVCSTLKLQGAVALAETAIQDVSGLATKNELDDEITAIGSRIDGLDDKIGAVEAVIPAQAAATNQLADKEFVNSSVQNMAARYVTPTATGDTQWTSLATLNAGPWYYKGASYTPTEHDYAIYVNTDNTVWRAGYNGTQWVAQYKVNDTAFTSAQLAALNSGITAAQVAKIGTALQTDGSNAMLANLDVGGKKITRVADPTANTDGANKKYVDDAVAALDARTVPMPPKTVGRIRLIADGGKTFWEFEDGSPAFPCALMPDGKIWMTVNLDITELNGDSIGCYYSNSPAVGAKYGRLYTWQEAMDLAASISGWHLPSSAEYLALVAAIGGNPGAGTKLKARSGWNFNGNGTDDYGFSALPGGFVNPNGNFDRLGQAGYWRAVDSTWSSTSAHVFGMNAGDNEVTQYPQEFKYTYYSVRLVKD
jgi:uncharacterized protein (TIGR02145 family)